METKWYKSGLLIAERVVVLLFLIEEYCINRLLAQPTAALAQSIAAEALQRGVHAMFFGAILIFVMGDRLIYRNDSAGKPQLSLRRHGYVWFLLFYAVHLVFSFALDGRLLFWDNGRGVGLLLFLVKLAAVLYMGAVLHKLPAVSTGPASEREAGIMGFLAGDRYLSLGTAALILLLILDGCLIPSATTLHSVISVSELILLAYLLFRPQGTRKKATSFGSEDEDSC